MAFPDKQGNIREKIEELWTDSSPRFFARLSCFSTDARLLLPFSTLFRERAAAGSPPAGYSIHNVKERKPGDKGVWRTFQEHRKE